MDCWIIRRMKCWKSGKQKEQLVIWLSILTNTEDLTIFLLQILIVRSMLQSREVFFITWFIPIAFFMILSTVDGIVHFVGDVLRCRYHIFTFINI